MKALFFGGTAFVGLLCVEQLVSNGHSVSILSRRTPPDPVLKCAKTDIIEIPSERVPRLLDESFDVSFDFISLRPSVSDWILENTSSKHHVFVSSMSAYLPFNNSPFSSTFRFDPKVHSAFVPTTPIEEYGLNKLLTEERCLKHLTAPTTIIRPPVVIGKGDPTNRFQKLVANIRDGKSIPVVRGSRFQLAFATDLAKCLVSFAESPPEVSRIVNFAHPRVWSQDEFVLVVADALGVKANLHFVEFNQQDTSINPYLRLIDHVYSDSYEYDPEPAEQLIRNTLNG